MTALSKLSSRIPAVVAIVALVIAMGGSWTTLASAAPTAPAGSSASASPAARSASLDDPDARGRPSKKAPSGKLNLNTATEEQLLLLPTVGPAKAERIVTWRKKNGGFKRVADLRRVKGFGYRTFKRLEPLLAIAGDTSLSLGPVAQR